MAYMQYISSFLTEYLFFVISILLILVFLLFSLNIWLYRSIKTLQARSAEFFAGNNVKSIEDIIINHSKSIKTLDKEIQDLYNISNQINSLAYKGLHKFAMIRFNPFKEVGGDQSFAIAILNGKNNGLTISSLYTREGTRVYSKSIINGESEKYPLTKEEIEVIQLAIENNKKK